MTQQRAALISVSDKSGICQFAKELIELGYTVLSTSGSGRLLSEEGIPFLSIEEYTGQKEILGGRVKTLHPKVHAGILARRDDAEHMQELADNSIMPIDVVAVNLYPFEKQRAGETANNPLSMVEQVDIGGPTMIRAAAKNFQHIYPVIDPADYSAVVEELRSGAGTNGRPLRLKMARKVFGMLAEYNLQIAQYFSYVTVDDSDALEIELTSARAEAFQLGEFSGFIGRSPEALRYGENPHQGARFYQSLGVSGATWEQLQGKDLSYNNLLDADACLSLLRRFQAEQEPCSIIIKHLNPCGAAHAKTSLEALRRAKKSDGRSHFGGIFGFTHKLDAESAQEVIKDFAEIVLAPDYDPEALAVFSSRKNLRVLRVTTEKKESSIIEVRSALGGILTQTADTSSTPVSEAELVAGSGVSDSLLVDLEFAWKISAAVRSNAIALAKEGLLLGVGAGQMSRIDSVEFAIWKSKEHGHELHGSVAASDAFFPFADGLERLAAEGVVAVITPSGSLKDQEVVEVASKLGLSLYFVNDRHFRH